MKNQPEVKIRYSFKNKNQTSNFTILLIYDSISMKIVAETDYMDEVIKQRKKEIT